MDFLKSSFFTAVDFYSLERDNKICEVVVLGMPGKCVDLRPKEVRILITMFHHIPSAVNSSMHIEYKR